MSLQMVLFDLDGTLLPMDQEVFTAAYFKGLAARLAPHGYEPKTLIDAIWKGTAAMVRNDGRKRNEDVFWDVFDGIFGERARQDRGCFETFYREDFDRVRAVCGFNPEAAETVRELKRQGLRVALATNPIFPAIATEKRIGWAGLNPGDFEWYTTYENSSFCKPNPDYYRELVRILRVEPESCLMVGNDAREDAAAEETGMEVFLLTDCLLNRDNRDLSLYPHGGFGELRQFINEKRKEPASV